MMRLMNVSVKIVRGVDKKGIVDIMMESELRGKIAATFQAKEDGIHGLVATDIRGDGRTLLKNMALDQSYGFSLAERMMMLLESTQCTS